MKARPRLLFLCQNLPFPPDGGALIRSYHTLRLLSEAFDVTALCFFRRATRSTARSVREGLEGLRRLGEADAFPIPQEHDRIRFLLDHARANLSGRAYVRWAYESRGFRDRLEAVLSEGRIDLVHVDSLDLVAYLPRLVVAGKPLVVAHHNVESQLLSRRAAIETGWTRRYLDRQAVATAREEACWCPRVALNVVVSEGDRAELSRVAGGGRYLVVPNGVDIEALRPPEHQSARQGIVFVGGHTWFPNRDAMDYFTESILPRIRADHPDVPVTWVGRASAEVRESFVRRGVAMTGYVDDIRPFVQTARCFVVPLRVGGGTRLKILDAWALGSAVVSTSAGAEGLDAVEGANVLLADTPDAFAAAVGRVLDDELLRRRLVDGGRRTAVESYSWRSIGQPMIAAYRQLVRA